MNCEQYKESIAADPSESFEGGAGHSAACSPCSAFKAEMQALDVRISAALEIDVPDLAMPELPPITAEEKVVDLASRRRGSCRRCARPRRENRKKPGSKAGSGALRVGVC